MNRTTAVAGFDRIALAALLAAGLGAPEPAPAAEAADAEFTALVGHRSGGSFKDPDSDATLDLDEGAGYGLILNLDHDANTQWEILYSRQDTELQLGPAFSGDRVFDLDVHYFSVGGIYVWRDPKVEPFIGAGIGITHLDPRDSRYDSETRAMIQFVGGYKFFLTDQIALRLEARGYGTLLDSDAAVFCGDGLCIARVESSGFGQLEFNAGLTVRF